MNPRFLSSVASYDLASNVRRTLAQERAQLEQACGAFQLGAGRGFIENKYLTDRQGREYL